MRLKDSQPRRNTISLTPLIDVVFLLLIFFMLASTFMKFSAVPISGTAGGTGQAALDEIVLIQLRPNGQTLINGKDIGQNETAQHLNALIAKGIKRAVIRPDADSTVQDIVRILEIAKSTPLKNVVVVR